MKWDKKDKYFWNQTENTNLVVFFFLQKWTELKFFCLDEISFRRDYKSCRIGVVVVRRRRATFMETLRWANFCNFGATLLKKNQKKTWIFTMGYLANALS